MSSESLADKAVQALALLQAMDADITLKHPERHAVRSLKRIAAQALDAALRQVVDLAYQAKDLSTLVREIEAERNDAGEQQ
jgi:hypothetical protein